MKPLLVYDGDCGFCRLWIERWRATTGDRVEYATYQEVADRFPEVPRERFAAAVQLREPDGKWSGGAEAVFRAQATAPGRRWPLWLYRRVPGVRPLTEAAYRLVAANRGPLYRVTRWIWGDHVAPPGETLTAWIFLRLLAVVYLVAFVSMWVQVQGIAGPDGILPARDFLAALHAKYGRLAFWIAPTLGWLGTSAGFLNAMCAAGVALSVGLVLGAAPIACLAGLWLTYLSLSILGQDFFWFQWDSLLLETGLLAILIAPWRGWSRPWNDAPPRRSGLWLMRWLLFRLSFSSAAVKLLSGDPSWHARTALQYHFETQPLPPWTAWFAHHLSAGLLRASSTGTLILEGIVPFLVFLPRRIRFVGVGLIASLQILILVTGNYGFFNWLTLALCVLCLDDGVWPRGWRERTARWSANRRGSWFGWAIRPLAVVFFLLSLVPFLSTLHAPTAWLGPVEYVSDLVWPVRSFNRYGLFAVMTTRRLEIVLEGSADGVRWLPYELRWKPGDPARRPEFVAPHQPRLDWQMWFAALSNFQNQPWFLQLCRRLLEGSQPVAALFATDPFPRAPPKYLRAVVYDYHFTTAEERKRTGAWWRREQLGLYCPVLALQNGQLVAVGSTSP
ncbi:MAG TPA: lipase maturation factor family protein [Candidatus Eisenbacteria bacterium]|nr:lipase maturation factor family protein [Candidatus Eisenbacteria bacterium]